MSSADHDSKKYLLAGGHPVAMESVVKRPNDDGANPRHIEARSQSTTQHHHGVQVSHRQSQVRQVLALSTVSTPGRRLLGIAQSEPISEAKW